MNIQNYQLFWGSLGTRVLTHPHIFANSIRWTALSHLQIYAEKWRLSAEMETKNLKINNDSGHQPDFH